MLREQTRVSKKRPSRTPNGNVRYLLTTLCRDGTTHVIFEPLDFIARLAALVTQGKWGRGGKSVGLSAGEAPTVDERRAAAIWAQRLKRDFGIDIETRSACGGAMRILTRIEDSAVIDMILAPVDARD
jgi:hypothetical protein